MGCWLPGTGLRCWLRLELGLGGWAELCLGGLLDGQGLFHTHLGLRLGGELLAGLGLRRKQEVKAWPAWAELLGQPD